MMRPKMLPRVSPSFGEMLCPRKGEPFPTVIAAAMCKSLYEQNGLACQRKNCINHIDATAYLDEQSKLREQSETKVALRDIAQQEDNSL